VVCPLPGLKQLPPLEISLIDLVDMNAFDLVDADHDGDPRIALVKALRIQEKYKLKKVLPFETLPSSLRLILRVELGVTSNKEFFDLQLSVKADEHLPSPCWWYLARCGGWPRPKRLQCIAFLAHRRHVRLAIVVQRDGPWHRSPGRSSARTPTARPSRSSCRRAPGRMVSFCTA
jgi:hypothetical protein